MFFRLAAVALVASSYLLGAVAEPIPIPTPTPVLDERDIKDIFNSLVSNGASLFQDVTGAVGSVATVVTSVGGEAATFITAIGGSAFELASSGVSEGVAAVTSVGGQVYTVVIHPTSTAATNPTTTPTTTKNAAAPLRAVGVSLPITISLVSTILAISLGARLVL